MHSKNYLQILLYEMMYESQPIFPQAISRYMNPFYQDVKGFYPYFQRTWEFIYGTKEPLFDTGTHQFYNLNAVADSLWKDGESAARFFSREKMAFSSREDAYIALNTCEQIMLSPEDLFPSIPFHNSLSNLFQVLLLLILRKVVKNSVTSLLEYLKPLFDSQQEAIQ